MLADCLEMHVFGTNCWRLDILWSVNILAPSLTKWTRACDKRLASLSSCIHHTNGHRQYCHVGDTARHCRLGSFQDSDFAGDPEDSESTSGRILCIFGSRTFVPISWMCENQTPVSHSSTESEGSCFSGCWFAKGWYSCSRSMGCGDRSIAVRNHCRKDEVDQVPRNRARSEIRSTNTNTKSKKRNREIDELSIVDHVVTSAEPALFEAQWYTFEYNESVIKMITTGRSPTMRHVSRARRVALD